MIILRNNCADDVLWYVALGFFAVGLFAMGQFAVKKNKKTKPNLTFFLMVKCTTAKNLARMICKWKFCLKWIFSLLINFQKIILSKGERCAGHPGQWHHPWLHRLHHGPHPHRGAALSARLLCILYVSTLKLFQFIMYV